jgi:hypothetical protein
MTPIVRTQRFSGFGIHYKSGSSRIWLQTARHALQGRNDLRCSENGVRARPRVGVAPHVRGRVGNGRGMEARQGAMRIFFWRYLFRHPRPQPDTDVLPQAHRSRPPRTPDARSGEAWAARRPGRFRRGSREGTVRRIAHRAKPNGGLPDAAAGTVFQKKCGWPPAALPSARCCRRPQGSPVRPAPADAQDTVPRMVNPPPLPDMCGVQLHPR